MLSTKPQYQIGQKVLANGWVRSDTGTILDIQETYHPRLGQYCWGYKIQFDGEGPGLTFTYIPEGYLRETKEEVRNKKIDDIIDDKE